jgi:putative thioredoxin
MMTDSPYILETTEATFQTDVVERSKDVPVVVDFWAEWCGPCKILAPVLEKLANEYQGQFVLAKANVDQLPNVSSAMGIRSIPVVFGIKNGQVVDSFTGALSEEAVRLWLKTVLPTPAETLAADARRLEATDPATAESKYRSAMTLDPSQPRVLLGLARMVLAKGQVDEAREYLQELESRGFTDYEVEQLKAELLLKSHAQPSGGVVAARSAAAANPGDLKSQLALAESLAAQNDFEEALDICLTLVAKDRRGVGESARQAMLAIFRVLPEDSPIANDYRRRLSQALY